MNRGFALPHDVHSSLLLHFVDDRVHLLEERTTTIEV
jgi:hypothetical protein